LFEVFDIWAYFGDYAGTVKADAVVRLEPCNFLVIVRGVVIHPFSHLDVYRIDGGCFHSVMIVSGYGGDWESGHDLLKQQFSSFWLARVFYNACLKLVDVAISFHSDCLHLVESFETTLYVSGSIV
jgi:hypothetical protein